jgi:hypothetical protein
MAVRRRRGMSSGDGTPVADTTEVHVCDEDLFIFTENATNGMVSNAEAKGDLMVIWLLRTKGEQDPAAVCAREMEVRGIEPTAYLAVYHTMRTAEEYPMCEFQAEFFARMKDGKPWVWHEPVGFTTKKKPLTVNRLDIPRITEASDIIEVSDAEGFIDCPFAVEVTCSRSPMPDGCGHPKNGRDCGLKDGRDVIPAHCPLRRAVTIIRLKKV